MYLRHFAFSRFPFETNLHADELFASAARREADARLNHLLELRGIDLLTGEVGSGKTTVCRHVTSTLHPGRFRVFYVSLSRLSMAVHESLNQRLVVRHHIGGIEREELDARSATAFRALSRVNPAAGRPFRAPASMARMMRRLRHDHDVRHAEGHHAVGSKPRRLDGSFR